MPKPKTKPNDLDIPKNIRVRYSADGSFFIPRPNKEAEAVLDKLGVRVPNQLRWYPRVTNCNQLSGLESLVKGKICYIVGKGPSLDALTEEHFIDDGAIITLNEAVHKVETLDLENPIIAVQQDPDLGPQSWSERGVMLVPMNTAHIYREHPRLYAYNHTQLKLDDKLSVSVAIGVAQLFKATMMRLLCFDAYTHNDIDYAGCIGHPSSKGGAPDRFLKHKGRIDRQLAVDDLDYEFITPEDQSTPSSYTPEQ